MARHSSSSSSNAPPSLDWEESAPSPLPSGFSTAVLTAVLCHLAEDLVQLRRVKLDWTGIPMTRATASIGNKTSDLIAKSNPIPTCPQTPQSATDYFQKLSTGYARQTGDSTYKVAHAFLSKLSRSALSSPAIIHDNACGVGTATTAILSLTGRDPPSRIDATDSSPAMIHQLSSQVSADGGWKQIVHPAVTDSHHLSFADNTFTFSITNISISNFADPVRCLREIHRTLQPGGRAVVSSWKRFTVAELIHQAQRAIKGPDVKLMEMLGAEFMRDGYLRERIVEAGFGDREVHQTVEGTIIQGEALEGLREFMIGGFTMSAKAGWMEGEQARWKGAIDEAIVEETARNGGIWMEAWFVTARK